MRIWTILALLFMVVTTVHSALAVVTCQTDSLTRVVPATTDNAFSVTYKITSTNGGKCGAIIEDSVSGPCSFDNGGKTVLISDNCDVGTSVDVKVSLTADQGTCVFSGNYNFGDCTPNKLLNSDSTKLEGVVVKQSVMSSLPDVNKKTEGSAADQPSVSVPTCKFYQKLDNNNCVTNKYLIIGGIILIGVLAYNNNYKKLFKVK